MSQTTYYEFNKPTGSVLVNPLTDTFPNWDIADDALHGLSVSSIGTAVEIVSLGVHALTRTTQPDAKFFSFVATGDYDAGETFTVDGVAIPAALPDGSPLATDAYVTGATVLCGLNADDTLLTFYVPSIGAAPDSERLGGELPSYYATKTYADGIKNTADAASALSITNAGDINDLKTGVTELNKSISNNVIGTLVNNTDTTMTNDGVVVVSFQTNGAQYGGATLIVNGVTVMAFGQVGPSNTPISNTFSYRVKKDDIVNCSINTTYGTTGTCKVYALS